MSGVGLNVGDAPVTAVYVGSTPVTAVYVGAEKVWPTIEVVQITLGTGYQARNQFRAALTERGLSYQTVTEIPFEIELVGTGSTNYMFYGCSSLTSVPVMDTSSVTNMSFMFSLCPLLTTVPDMDTSQVTNMNAMFYECASLTHVPDMDTSSVTNMSFMFDACPSLTHVPDMATGQVTDMRYMFQNCSALTDGNVRLIGRHPDVDTAGMIDGSGLTREPFYTTDGQPWPTGPRVVTVSTNKNEWIVGSQSGDVSMIQELTGTRHLVFSAPVTCDDAINAGSAGTFAAGNRLEAGWILAPVGFRDQLYTFTEVL